MDKEQLRAMLEGTPVSRIEKAEIMYAAPARYQVRGPMINLILKSNLGQRSSLKGELFSSYEQSRREHINERATCFIHQPLCGGLDVYLLFRAY